MSPKNRTENLSTKEKLTKLTASTLIALGAIGLSACSDVEAKPTPPAVSDTVEPSETPQSPELTVDQLEIRAGLSAEQAGQAIIKHFDGWINAGTNDSATYKEWVDWTIIDKKGTSLEFLTAKAEEYGALYSEVLYVEGWQDNEDLVRNYDFNVSTNANTLELNLKTSFYEGISLDIKSSKDIEGFQRNIHFEAAREIYNEGGSRVVEIDYTESINADKNRVGESIGTGYSDNWSAPPAGLRMTLVTVGGVEKISSIEAFAR